MRCSRCGSENPSGNSFCGDCGEPLANLCPKCGADNPAGKRFCGKCGSALGAAPQAAAPRKSNRPPVPLAEATAPQNLEGERKTVTALFADIKGSTELEQDLDPEEARAIVDPALKLMIDAVQRYDGYVVQSTGDGIFAIFGAPVAHEDHPQRSLYAALRMQDELRRYSSKLREAGNLPIEARIGANTGEVVVRSISTGGKTEYTPIGHTANLASRMQALAPTGSIAISEATRKLCEGYFTLKPLGPTKVRGVSEPVNVYEVTGLGPLRTRLQRSAGRGLTKFVGREREMESMRAASELAKTGHAQIVAAVAEAGTGKSRLFFEFKAKNQSGWMVLEAFSVSHGKASAYLPVLDLLHSYFDIKSEDDTRKRREKVTGRVLALDRSLEDALPYLLALLGIVEGEDPLAQMDAQIKKRRTLDAIKRILLRESLNQPLIVMFEDLHWIDEQTQEFLNLLADSIANAKILLLVNYRPQYSHQWGSRTYYTQLRLDPLGKESADEMLAALLGDGAVLLPLKRLIIDRTEGNPFFMEETVQVLLDEGALVRNGATYLTKPIAELKIPPTVQGILAARIDRLPAGEKDLLQTLAVMGKEFTLRLVRAVRVDAEDELNRMLNDLQLSEFIYEQPAVGDVEYAFKHALTQEVAYNSVLQERRRALHERIGEAMESLHAGSLDDHLGELAHHYSRSANADKAVRYLALAGKQSLARFAFAEAQAQLQRALELLKTLPPSAERAATELELVSALAVVLLMTKGFNAPELREATARAATLAEESGNLGQLVLQLHLNRLSAMTSGDHAKSSALADQMLDLARREGSPTSLAFAHHAQMQSRFYRGDLIGAEEHFTRWKGFRDAGIYSNEDITPAVAVLNTASQCAFIMGYSERARERIAEAIAAAQESNNPYALGIARVFEFFVYRFSRDLERAGIAATQLAFLSDGANFPFLKAAVPLATGWERAQRSHPGEGISLIRAGLAGLAELGISLGTTDYRTCLAEAQALVGMIDDALITIEGALEANPEELVYRPNILTRRGELRLEIGKSDIAEADFREAIALAQQMSAKAWELRATTSLARLLRDTDRRDEARTMLAKIYNWFTEGFDTADLKDAKALLDELNDKEEPT